MYAKKYYVDTDGNDDPAYRKAMAFACKLAEENQEIERVILLIGQKGNDGWFERIFDRDTVKELYQGLRFSDCRPLFKFETIRTYKDNSRDQSDIIIACGLSSDDLFKFDDYYCVYATIAIPWTKPRTEEWIKTWKPLDIRKGNTEKNENSETISCIVQKAMKSLTASINRSTGIHNSADNDLAKTYILALHHSGELKDATELRSYLVRDLNWDSDDAQDMYKLVHTLNSGKHFKGGSRDKETWKFHMNNWRIDCQNNNS